MNINRRDFNTYLGAIGLTAMSGLSLKSEPLSAVEAEYHKLAKSWRIGPRLFEKVDKLDLSSKMMYMPESGFIPECTVGIQSIKPYKVGIAFDWQLEHHTGQKDYDIAEKYCQVAIDNKYWSDELLMLISEAAAIPCIAKLDDFNAFDTCLNNGWYMFCGYDVPWEHPNIFKSSDVDIDHYIRLMRPTWGEDWQSALLVRKSEHRNILETHPTEVHIDHTLAKQRRAGVYATASRIITTTAPRGLFDGIEGLFTDSQVIAFIKDTPEEFRNWMQYVQKA